MSVRVMIWRLILPFVVLGSTVALADRHRYRRPAPLEDRDSNIEFPVFGGCAGLPDTARQAGVMEWVAKRTWHVLGLPYERKDFTGPPRMRPTPQDDGWVLVQQTVTDAGVPLRNQIVAAEVVQLDEPILMTLRCTDAFGELLLEIDFAKGFVRVRSVTVSRSMIGGQAHSSPMPEQSSSRVVTESTFRPMPSGVVKLKVKTLGRNVTVWAGDREIVSFVDPDPAAGKFGFGSGELGFADDMMHVVPENPVHVQISLPNNELPGRERLQSGQKCTIAVRVWNVNWCGGIWKNVKLIAGRTSR